MESCGVFEPSGAFEQTTCGSPDIVGHARDNAGQMVPVCERCSKKTVPIVTEVGSLVELPLSCLLVKED